MVHEYQLSQVDRKRQGVIVDTVRDSDISKRI